MAVMLYRARYYRYFTAIYSIYRFILHCKSQKFHFIYFTSSTNSRI